MKGEHVLRVNGNCLDCLSPIPREYCAIVESETACCGILWTGFDALRPVLRTDEAMLTVWDVIRSRNDDIMYPPDVVLYFPFYGSLVCNARFCAMKPCDCKRSIVKLTDKVRSDVGHAY